MLIGGGLAGAVGEGCRIGEAAMEGEGVGGSGDGDDDVPVPEVEGEKEGRPRKGSWVWNV